jgi:putative oxidoreductase
MDIGRTLLATLSSPARRLTGVAPLFARVVLGCTLAWHGYQKFHGGLSGVKDFFGFLNIPLPGVFAAVVAVLELVGGLCIVAGLATRLLSILFIIELAVALFRYKYGEHVGFIGAKEAGAELDWVLIAGFVALAASGAGAWSLDRILGLERPVAHAAN